MKEEINQVLKEVHDYVRLLEGMIFNNQDDEITKNTKQLNELLENVGNMLPIEIYSAFEEFFCELKSLLVKCAIKEFYSSNREVVTSSLQLLTECLEEIRKLCNKSIEICACCGYDVIYENGICPCCGCDEQERLEKAEGIDEDLCNNGPLISVLLPCYNHEQYVAEAIESVINQSYKNIEFLVADDASKDGTAEVMKLYEKYYDKSFYFEKNEGGRYSFLKEYATGKYVALMHSDDVWEQDKLAMQVEYMEKHPNCDVCLTWAVYTDEDSNEIEGNVFIQKNRCSSEWMRFFFENGNVLCNPSFLAKKEVCLHVQKYGSAFWQLPDFFKWIDIIQYYNIHIIPTRLVKMKRHNKPGFENQSSCTKENFLRDYIECGSAWGLVIRDMNQEFFKKAFSDLMINPEASTEQEIICEKYFLLLKHKNPFVQNSAFLFFTENFSKTQNCFKEKYNYTKVNYKEDMLKVGLAPLFSL